MQKAEDRFTDVSLGAQKQTKVSPSHTMHENEPSRTQGDMNSTQLPHILAARVAESSSLGIKRLILVSLIALVALIITIALSISNKKEVPEPAPEPSPTVSIDPHAGTITQEGTLDSPYIL